MGANKFKLFIILPLCCIIFSSCFIIFEYDSPPFATSLERWNIKNSTTDTLQYVFCNQSKLDTFECVNPSSLVFVASQGSENKEPLIVSDFNYMIKKCNYDSIVIMHRKRVVKTWRKSEANKEGKQFFKESSWTRKEDKGNNRYEWIFEIRPEDLEIPEK